MMKASIDIWGETTMKFYNAKVLGDDFTFKNASVEVENGVFTKIDESNSTGDIDVEGKYIIPGLIDTHMHSAMGKTFIDFDDETNDIIFGLEAKMGTTSLCPAISAAPTKKMLGCIKNLVEYERKDGSARCMGIHLEGPYFAVEYKGAHLPENIRKPTVEETKTLIEAGKGMVKIITMAPELEGAKESIELLRENNVVVSIGHTNATYEQAIKGIDMGATQSTHTFNAMSGLNHRKPGTVGAVLGDDRVKCEFICDFFHVSPHVVKMAYKLKGEDNINIITDSELGTGLGDGEYEVNGRKIIVKNGETRTEDGTIAGGTSFLIDGVRNMVSIGVPLESAVKMASLNPAKTLGEDDKIGSIKEGKWADFIILDNDLNICDVYIGGERVER
ncbi:MAG: N-acetylglucosamine-6-phosphate deacetylase [Clostridia bacterium]|nr:N-acetylglucosamine-6-phosphate deacetylase [Clostridia bacterium]